MKTDTPPRFFFEKKKRALRFPPLEEEPREPIRKSLNWLCRLMVFRKKFHPLSPRGIATVAACL